MEQMPKRPELSPEATAEDAKRYVRALVPWVGPGFHPDTNFHDYVRFDPRERSYEPGEADALNRDLDRAVEVLGKAGIDPCAIALPVLRRFLREMGVR